MDGIPGSLPRSTTEVLRTSPPGRKYNQNTLSAWIEGLRSLCDDLQLLPQCMRQPCPCFSYNLSGVLNTYLGV